MPVDLPPAWVLQIRQEVGRRVRSLREARDLSQEDLAELAGVSRFTIYRTELGTHAASVDVIVRIARALDVPSRELFPEE